MSAFLLEQHWLRALDVAADAVEASARAHTLPPPESGGYRRRVAAERAWFATVDWSSFEPARGGTISVLEPRPEAAGASAIRPAA
jgi:hypothetical protein